MDNVFSLYIHIPFCRSKCDYCDFYSLPVGPGLTDAAPDAYLEALLSDVRAQLRFAAAARVETVYVGGGTPSVLGAARAASFFGRLRGLLPAAPSEWTVEVNPESVDDAFLRACDGAGVSRISAGVQSFDGAVRRAVRRAGSAARLRRGLERIAARYGGRFSADLISALPGADERGLERDIRALAALGCPHISLYDLAVAEESPLAKRARAGRVALVPEDAAAEMWRAGRETLAALGYAQYEVSNFAKDGAVCRHNMRYWRMESWLGAGAAASGTLVDEAVRAATRFTGKADAAGYARAARRGAPFPSAYRREAVSRDALARETLLMGFRLAGGPDAALFERRFSRPLEQAIPRALSKWRAAGLARADRAALTPDGLLFLNAFLRDCFEEMPPL